MRWSSKDKIVLMRLLKFTVRNYVHEDRKPVNYRDVEVHSTQEFYRVCTYTFR